MIVRVLGEGQWRVKDQVAPALERLEEQVSAAIEARDEVGLQQALGDIVERIACHGDPLEDDDLFASQLILPDPATTLAEVDTLLETTRAADRVS